MVYEFGYDHTVQTADIPEANVLATLKSLPVKHEHIGVPAVDIALQNPIGEEALSEKAKKALSKKEDARFVIITSDISRPCPSYKILPSVLRELYTAGVSKEQITVIFALGSHRNHTEEEMRHLVGDEVFETVRCMDSTPDDVIHMGRTKHGTDVDITRVVAEADFRIGVGNIEFHYFAGFSGGAKALMPGVSTPRAIEQNHALMVQEKACAGNITDNPLRIDIEEAETYCHLDYIVNVVLDEHKEIVYAVAGDVTKAHRVGCAYLSKMYSCPIPKKADIVIVSQGGAPKDANLYQTQKAIDNAKHAVRDGGTMIVVGCCKEGFGSKIFEEWLLSAESPEALIERIAREFKLGGHKAAAIAMVEVRAQMDLVSEMDPDTVRNIFMTPRKSLQEAVGAAFLKYGPDASVILMPYGGSTLPIETK